LKKKEGISRRDGPFLSFLELSYLPAAHTEKEAEDIALLLLLKFLDVLEGTHLYLEDSD